ncbi:MAG: hypothetical protein C4334_03295 [Pyrinomonas sp.]
MRKRRTRSYVSGVFALALALAPSTAPIRAQIVQISTHAPIETKQEPALVEDDPIKLFERGQDAHARGDYARAIAFYEQALKLRPEFPEAEFQKAMALLASKRSAEAKAAFARATELRPDWVFAYAAFGSALVTTGDAAAEKILRQALALEPRNRQAIVALARLKERTGDLMEALRLIKQATALADATAADWHQRALLELASGDKRAALASLDRALTLDADDVKARLARARLLIELNEPERAIGDLRLVTPSDEALKIELATLWARIGRRAEAIRWLDALGEATKQRSDVIALRAQLADEIGEAERAALEQALSRDPRNSALLAQLGETYRRSDPTKSLDYYRRAAELEPNNVAYIVGYGAALVQARRFAEAVTVLRSALAVDSANYAAHANLAAALDELKLYDQALIEYEWIRRARPDVAITDYFIGRALDLLGRYEEALAAYERFLARADEKRNALEIERVKLRLPRLREQIERHGKRGP